MLRMDGFAFAWATSPEHAVALFQSAECARYIAGGTDLLPNLKHRIERPTLLVGLGRALPQGLVHEDDGGVTIGAATRLATLAIHESTRPDLRALAQAAASVGGPQIRQMGTLGGNVLLDTRCLFVNQSHTWRQALGHCLKADGDWCHVIGGPKTCVATQASDTVPVLMALGAELSFMGAAGLRRVPLTGLFHFDGRTRFDLAPEDVLVAVHLPPPHERLRIRYDKVRTRGAIDFPQLGVATAVTLGEDNVLDAIRIVIGAVSPRPRPVRGTEQFLGQSLTDAVTEALADLAWKRTRPLASTHGDPAWRRQMVRVTVRRALTALRDDGAQA